MKPSSQPWGSRRSFLKASGSLAAATGAGLVVWPGWSSAAETNRLESPTLVGSNLYVWTQYFQREKRTLDLGEVMAALRDGGYDYLEGNLDVSRPEANAQLAAQMKASGLKPVTLYTGGRLHEPDAARQTIARILAAAQVAQAAGFYLLSCNPDPIGREKTDQELRNQAAALDDLGAALQAIGVRLGIHHHLPEMGRQAREFHFIFRHTDPQRVGFNYDVHWVQRGGLKPQEVLPEYGARVISWHLRQSRKGVWIQALDTGEVDYAAVASYIREHHLARVLTVELALENGTEVTRSAFANHQLSREFVRKVFVG